MTQAGKSQLGRVVYPRWLNGTQTQRGQATLPNPEIFYLELSFTAPCLPG